MAKETELIGQQIGQAVRAQVNTLITEVDNTTIDNTTVHIYYDVLTKKPPPPRGKRAAREAGQQLIAQQLEHLGQILSQQQDCSSPTSTAQFVKLGTRTFAIRMAQLSILQRAICTPTFFSQSHLIEWIDKFRQPAREFLSSLWATSDVSPKLKTKIITALHAPKFKSASARPLLPSLARRS